MKYSRYRRTLPDHLQPKAWRAGKVMLWLAGILVWVFVVGGCWLLVWG